MVRDTIITIGRRVIPVNDTTVSLVELPRLEAPVLKGCELNFTSLELPTQELPVLPEFNTYICEQQDTTAMVVQLLKPIEIQAYPYDAVLDTFGTVALSVFTLWYISGSLNRWKHLYRDIKNCIFVG